MFLQALKNFLLAISSRDPTPFHFDIARKTLGAFNKEALKDDDNVYLLAKSFLESCNKLNKKIKITNSIEKTMSACRKLDEHDRVSYYLDFAEFPQANNMFEKQFFGKEGLSIWDIAYLKILISTGPNGQEQAKILSGKFKEKEEKWDRFFWFRKPDQEDQFFHSPAFLTMAGALWKDQVEKRVNFSNKNVPALTTSIHLPISQMLTPKNKVVECDNTIQVFHQDSLIGIVPIPAIPQNIVATVFKGVQKLNTVTGHRATRYLIRSAFEQIISGHLDFRVIKRDRGATDIAEELGLRSNQHVSNLREIFHAMAYFEFSQPPFSGNLIQLAKYKSQKTGRDEGLEITVGTPLVPFQTFDAYRQGECGLLIPLLIDPPLVGANQYHAGQYLLQMNIMGELSKNSNQLVQEGAVQLPKDKLEEFARACNLTSEILDKVLDRWTRDGDDGAKFLDRVEDDFYVLGEEHKKAHAFLLQQGERRINQSKRGKASVARKKHGKKKGNF